MSTRAALDKALAAWRKAYGTDDERQTPETGETLGAAEYVLAAAYDAYMADGTHTGTFVEIGDHVNIVGLDNDHCIVGIGYDANDMVLFLNPIDAGEHP